MPELECTFCGKTDCTSEYSLKRHLAVCSKRFSAYHVNEPVIESDKHIPRFASLKNDDDYDNDNENVMLMQDEDDIGILHDHNIDDESSYDIVNDVSSTSSDYEEEKVQYDFDDWFIEQMDIQDNKSEESTGKEDNFVQFLDNITSNSLMDYENEMTKKTQHLPPIPPEMQDAIQLLSLLNTSKASFSLYEKLVKWRQSSKSAIEDKKMPTRKEVLKFLTN